MLIGISIQIIGLGLILFSILLVLRRISKTLKSNGESLSKIAKHLAQINEGDKDKKRTNNSDKTLRYLCLFHVFPEA